MIFLRINLISLQAYLVERYCIAVLLVLISFGGTASPKYSIETYHFLSKISTIFGEKLFFITFFCVRDDFEPFPLYYTTEDTEKEKKTGKENKLIDHQHYKSTPVTDVLLAHFCSLVSVY